MTSPCSTIMISSRRRQFVDLLHTSSERPPEIRLLIAVLEGAIPDLTANDVKLRTEARSWVRGEPAAISFEMVCDALSISAERLRPALRKLAHAEPLSSCRDTVLPATRAGMEAPRERDHLTAARLSTHLADSPNSYSE